MMYDKEPIKVILVYTAKRINAKRHIDGYYTFDKAIETGAKLSSYGRYDYYIYNTRWEMLGYFRNNKFYSLI